MSAFSWYLLILFLVYVVYNVNEFIYIVRVRISRVIAEKEKAVIISRHLRYSAIATLAFIVVAVVSFFIHGRLH